MSYNYIKFYIIIFINEIISSTIILPFSYKNKKENYYNSNSKTSYFESKMDNTIYTSMKVYNQNIDFHLSMERFPIYISDKIYKQFNDKNIDNKKDTLTLYSLSQIGINRAALIKKNFFVKSNLTSENKIEEINLFRARKFMNISEDQKNRMNYASEDAEIGFNIVRGSQYEYVEERENDIDTEALMEEFEREKKIQKAYEEYYNTSDKNEDKKDINMSSYNPMHEYEFNNQENENGEKTKRAYSDEEIKEIYNIYNTENENEMHKKNKTNKNNNRDINKSKEDEEEKNIRFVGNGLFKEESANFISQLKKKDKINSYAFTIKYNLDKEENGEIIIGDLPHEYAPQIYSSENYFFDSVSITKEPPFNWHFKYKKLLYEKDEIDSKNIVKFSIDFGFLKGNYKLQNHLEQNFFNVNKCYKDKTKNNYDIYYCKEEALKNFKPIIFELESKYCPTSMNAKFEFNYQDLFIKEENNDIYFFQIIFPSSGKTSNWVFGKPLFKKYQMVFDQDRKTYGFYININNKRNDTLNTSLKISWTLVVILIIILLIVTYIVFKLISKLPRRLKANELEDSFTYDSATSKYNKIKDKNLGNISELDGKNKLYENL